MYTVIPCLILVLSSCSMMNQDSDTSSNVAVDKWIITQNINNKEAGDFIEKQEELDPTSILDKEVSEWHKSNQTSLSILKSAHLNSEKTTNHNQEQRSNLWVQVYKDFKNNGLTPNKSSHEIIRIITKELIGKRDISSHIITDERFAWDEKYILWDKLELWNNYNVWKFNFEAFWLNGKDYDDDYILWFYSNKGVVRYQLVQFVKDSDGKIISFVTGNHYVPGKQEIGSINKNSVILKKRFYDAKKGYVTNLWKIIDIKDIDSKKVYFFSQEIDSSQEHMYITPLDTEWLIFDENDVPYKHMVDVS